MATKHNNPCIEKARDDEPLFVLRSQDELAPDLVRAWARGARASGTPEKKVKEAFRCADAMDQWASTNGSKVPD